MSNWISVNEALPNRRQPALILCSYGKMATAILTDVSNSTYGWTDWMRPYHTYGSVTHWQPLPESPKQENYE